MTILAFKLLSHHSLLVPQHWLTGSKQGQADIFIENLPGSPDNITFNGRDTYWLALYAPRSSVVEFLQARPTLRGILTSAIDNGRRI
jgi:hypothetical protein